MRSHTDVAVASVPGLARAKAFIEDARELTCQYSDMVARQVGNVCCTLSGTRSPRRCWRWRSSSSRRSPMPTAVGGEGALADPAVGVAVGAKRIETRSWNTAYRGEIAIHAAKGFPRDYQQLVYSGPFLRALMVGGFNHVNELPLGAIVAVARLFTTGAADAVRFDYDDPAQVAEEAFGNYEPDRYAWFLQGVRRLPTPVQCPGALGLWTVPPGVEARVREGLVT